MSAAVDLYELAFRTIAFVMAGAGVIACVKFLIDRAVERALLTAALSFACAGVVWTVSQISSSRPVPARHMPEPASTPASVEPSPTPTPEPATVDPPQTGAGLDAVPAIAAIAAIVLIAAALGAGLYFVWVAVVLPKARAAAAARAKAKAQAELEKTRRAERRVAMGRALRSAVAIEDRVTARWLEYEKDLELALQYPVMRDLRDPLVQAVVTAMTRARAARVEEIPELDADQSPDAHPYVVAVHDLDVAMRAAEQEARRVRRGRFSREERRALSRAEQLLAIAKNDGASPHERRVAYQRLIITLEGILDVPEAARTQLEISTGARQQIGTAPAGAL